MLGFCAVNLEQHSPAQEHTPLLDLGIASGIFNDVEPETTQRMLCVAKYVENRCVEGYQSSAGQNGTGFDPVAAWCSTPHISDPVVGSGERSKADCSCSLLRWYFVKSRVANALNGQVHQLLPAELLGEYP